MGALEEFTKCVIGRMIATDYPHLKLPAIQYARITRATKLSETYIVDSIEITDETAGRTFTAHYAAHWYEYTLEMIDRFGNADDTYPPIPGVKSKLKIDKGAIVAVGQAFGDSPAIIGEVKL